MATLVNYSEPQIWEVFKNTLPSHLCWVLFPAENLRQAVETAKRIFIKEKLGRQLAGQSAGTPPILTVKEENMQGHKMVVLNESNVLGAKIDKLTAMIGKVFTQNRQLKPFKPRVYQGRNQSLTNSGRGNQYYNNSNRNRFYD